MAQTEAVVNLTSRVGSARRRLYKYILSGESELSLGEFDSGVVPLRGGVVVVRVAGHRTLA